MHILNYIKSKWYYNNKISTGLDWLCDIFDNISLSQSFKLLNLSANTGEYEECLYQHTKDEYKPYFVIGDALGSDFINNGTAVNSTNKFIYLNANCKAIDYRTYNDKYNVILDIKGALWHTLNLKKDKNKEVLKLLTHYYNLLEDSNSFFIIDDYCTNIIKCSISIASITGRYTKRKIKYHQEMSTYEYLNKYFNVDNILHNRHTIHPQAKKGYPLRKYMSVCLLSKEELFKLIQAISNGNSRITVTKFCFVKNTLILLISVLILTIKVLPFALVLEILLFYSLF